MILTAVDLIFLVAYVGDVYLALVCSALSGNGLVLMAVESDRRRIVL